LRFSGIIPRVSDATRLIVAIQGGDAQASDELLPLVYQELRRLARAQMAGERGAHTLQATALVHEAYLRLVKGELSWDGRRHFFGAAAEAMRRILIEHARRRAAQKCGGGRQRVDPREEELPVIQSPCDQIDDLLALDEALTRLASYDPSKAELVRLLFFVGLSLDEAAAALGVSRSTAHRQWQFARAWLFDAMGRPGA
jgi:RNA polymerase sigma factor (TIGR02999 family)